MAVRDTTLYCSILPWWRRYLHHLSPGSRYLRFACWAKRFGDSLWIDLSLWRSWTSSNITSSWRVSDISWPSQIWVRFAKSIGIPIWSMQLVSRPKLGANRKVFFILRKPSLNKRKRELIRVLIRFGNSKLPMAAFSNSKMWRLARSFTKISTSYLTPVSRSILRVIQDSCLGASTTAPLS